jgi:hypothetical protein
MLGSKGKIDKITLQLVQNSIRIRPQSLTASQRVALDLATSVIALLAYIACLSYIIPLHAGYLRLGGTSGRPLSLPRTPKPAR